MTKVIWDTIKHEGCILNPLCHNEEILVISKNKLKVCTVWKKRAENNKRKPIVCYLNYTKLA